MEFSEIKDRALEIREKYRVYETQVIGKPWTYVEQTQGLMVDVGELMELVMAKAGFRKHKGKDLDTALAHELSDVLESILIIAQELNIDLEKAFWESRQEVEVRITKRINDDNNS